MLVVVINSRSAGVDGIVKFASAHVLSSHDFRRFVSLGKWRVVGLSGLRKIWTLVRGLWYFDTLKLANDVVGFTSVFDGNLLSGDVFWRTRRHAAWVDLELLVL